MLDLNHLRFNYEAALFSDLKSTLGDQIQAQGEHYLHLNRHQLLGYALKITPDILPDLYQMYQKCLSLIGNGLEGDIYVQQQMDYNASVFSLNRRFDIIISSAIVRDFKLNEIAFVVGHELGHVLFDHSQIPLKPLLSAPEGVSYYLARSLFLWSRAAEISADRIGLLCSGSLGSAACTFFKLSSGLSFENEDIIIRTLRQQFEGMQKLSALQNLGMNWATTHPMIPIRFRSLEMISLDVLAVRNGNMRRVAWQEIDQKIQTILKDTETLDAGSQGYFSSREGISRLLLCLLFVAASDGQVNIQEERFIRDMQVRMAPGIDIDAAILEAKSNPTRFMRSVLQEIKPTTTLSRQEILKALELCFYHAITDAPLNQAEKNALREIEGILGQDCTLVDMILKDNGLG